MKPGFSGRLDLLRDPVGAERAEKEFEEGQGPLIQHYSTCPTVFLQSEALFGSPEFKSLPINAQEHLRKPTVPGFEFAIVCMHPYRRYHVKGC
jgi:hypothetical protein